MLLQLSEAGSVTVHSASVIGEKLSPDFGSDRSTHERVSSVSSPAETEGQLLSHVRAIYLDSSLHTCMSILSKLCCLLQLKWGPFSLLCDLRLCNKDLRFYKFTVR